MKRSDDLVGVVQDALRRILALEKRGASRWDNLDNRVVTYSTDTTNQTGIGSSLTDVTRPAAVSWTGDSERLYRITLRVATLQVTSTGQQSVQIVTGTSGAGTELAAATIPGIVAGGQGLHVLSTFIVGAGSMSVHARAATSAGTLTIGNASNTGWLVVEDVGLA